MKAHNITLIMACLFTVATCAAHAAGVDIIPVIVLALDAICFLILASLLAPKESHR